jgi:hypothetical protein
MDEIIGNIEFCAGLLDDIAIWGDSIEQFYKRLKIVFKRLVEYGIMVNVRKTVMFVISEIFLGFVVSKEGIAADPDKVAAIRNRPQPTFATEVRAFVNAAGYFRHFLKNYSEVSSPLTDLIGGPKNQTLTLLPDAVKSWKKIRKALTTTPVVKSFNWTKPVVIETNGSNYHTGAALLQPHFHDNKRVLYPITYFSRKLTPRQARYSSQKRELLAILQAL